VVFKSAFVVKVFDMLGTSRTRAQGRSTNELSLRAAGQIKNVDDVTIPKKSLDLIFPSADFSSDKKLLKDLAEFASRSLRREGILMLHSKHTSVATVLKTISKTARDLKLIHILPIVLKIDLFEFEFGRYPIILDKTSSFLIFEKGTKRKEGDYFFEDDVGKNQDYVDAINSSAILFVIDNMMSTTEADMTVCDPAFGDGKIGFRTVERGLNFIGIESDFDRFRSAKQKFQGQPTGFKLEQKSDKISDINIK